VLAALKLDTKFELSITYNPVRDGRRDRWTDRLTEESIDS